MKQIFTTFIIAILLHSTSSATSITKEQIRNRVTAVKQIHEKIKVFAPKKTMQANLKSATSKQKNAR